MEHLGLFITLSLLAEVLGTVGGFGSSLFFVPIAGFFLDFHSVLGVTALFHLSSNVSKIALFRQGIDRRLVLLIGIPAVAFVTAGAYLSRFFEKQLLELFLGIFLIGISSIFLVFKTIRVRPTAFNSIGGGALSGLTAGLLGTGGAIRGLTLAAFELQKDVFIATSAVIDLGIDLSRSGVYIVNGYVHKHDLYLVAILFGVSLLGTLIGRKVLAYIPEEKFRGIVLGLILVIGIFTTVKQISG